MFDAENRIPCWVCCHSIQGDCQEENYRGGICTANTDYLWWVVPLLVYITLDANVFFKATADGALTTVVSVKDARFKRLQLVSDQLVRNAQHVAGLNPRAFRYDFVCHINEISGC